MKKKNGGLTREDLHAVLLYHLQDLSAQMWPEKFNILFLENNKDLAFWIYFMIYKICTFWFHVTFHGNIKIAKYYISLLYIKKQRPRWVK